MPEQKMPDDLIDRLHWVAMHGNQLQAIAVMHGAAAEIRRLKEVDAKRFKLFQARNEEIVQLTVEVEFLRSLRNDVAGCWSDLFETGLREVLGNTNYNVVARKLADTREPTDATVMISKK